MEKTNNAAKFAFFYMLSLVALLFMSLSGGMIIFQIINKNVIDVLNEFAGRFDPDQLKFAISALIIASPIYYLTMRQIVRNLFSGELAKESGIRKWLTYFILFVTSVVMLGWFIAVVRSFLDGELTTKFILKALTAISIAALIFTFYFYDIKRPEVVNKKSGVVKAYLFGSIALVVIIFIASLFIVESPAETRNRKIDQKILESFSQIDNAISTFYNDEKKLPANLNELTQEFNYITDRDLSDPITKKGFDYKVLDENTYELCAEFRSSNTTEDVYYDEYSKENWPHESGYQCIKQKVRQYEKGEVAPAPFAR
jgi:type II secretory pathway pseudopilin PulG